MQYPIELLPRKSLSLPQLQKDSCFIRTVNQFPTDCIQGYDFLPEIADEVLKPMGSMELYSLSVFLYGIFTEKHLNYSITDRQYFDYWDGSEELNDIPYEYQQRFAIFLNTHILNNAKIDYDGNTYILHYEHKPTRANFWHFELYVTSNDSPIHLPRKKGATRNKIANKIKEDVLYYSIRAAKDKFFSLYNYQL